MTDKIKFTVGGERHDLPIDGSKTLRVGDVSPDTKLTVTGAYTQTSKIVFNSDNGPAMTIHPDGKITLGENAEPTEAAAACIDAMSHMIQSIIDRAVSEERAAIVAWLRENSTPHNDIDEWADEIEAGVHLK